MKRRSRAGGKVTRAQRRKTVSPKHPSMRITAGRRGSPFEAKSEVMRLSRELNEALERETATVEILASISRSTSDTRPVFEAILDNLLRLFGTRCAIVILVRDGMLHVAALRGDPGFSKLAEAYPLPLDDRLQAGRAILSGRVLQLVPIIGNPDAAPKTEKLAVELGYDSMISVPLSCGGKVIGALNTAHRDPIAFTDRQVALIKSFADQAVIAIENARLLNELRQRTHDLSRSLEDLRTAQDRLVQTQKLASLGQLTAGIAHEIKNPLNFVNNFSDVSVELIEELRGTLGYVQADEKTRTDIYDLANTLRENLDKIAQHGKRADAIVKNMLLHSREGSGEHRPVDINGIVEEALNLAYHGARAEKQGFNITLERSFDPSAGRADIYPQEISRALLNFISNGFYAAAKRQRETGDGYEPTLTTTTKNLGDRVEITIRDNGTGIPPDVREKMFNPFFTTKPSGEGTGLGLSISHDIVVKQHAGSIEVDTEPGEFTEIKIILPRTSIF